MIIILYFAVFCSFCSVSTPINLGLTLLGDFLREFFDIADLKLWHKNGVFDQFKECSGLCRRPERSGLTLT